jgi:hypothetical protein
MAFRRICLTVGIVGAGLAAGCLDPRAAALKLFTDQGLALLQPARDYIKVGGLIVLARQGRPAYLDPYDSLPEATDDKPVTDFRALLLGQSVDTKTGLDIALNLAASLVKLPVGLTASKQQEVQMDQIDSTGKRLIPTAVDSLVQKKATSDAVKRQLNIRKGNRVFMVQEVYWTKHLSVKSTTGAKLTVYYGDGKSVGGCDEPSQTDTSKSDDSAKPGTATAKASDSTKASETSKGTPPANNAATSKPADAGKGTKGSDSAKGADTTKSQDSGATPGLSAVVCMGGTATLTIQSDSAIPFAVRLVELKVQGTDVVVEYTGFKFPGSLGSSDTEKRTALVNATNPVLLGLVHQTR